MQKRIQEAKDQLADRTSDRERDVFLKGMVWAFEEVLEAEPDIKVKVLDD